MSNAQDPIKLPDWEDHQVQIVYELLCNMPEGKPERDHWEGWTARHIVADLQSAAAQPQGDAREAAYASGEGISGAVDGPQFDYHFRLHINTYADKHPMLVVRQLAARLRAAWQAATAQASEPSAKVVPQWRKPHSADWYDGYPDQSDGGGPYETRTLYTYPTAPARAVETLTDEQFAAAMERELPGWNPDVNLAIYAHAVRHAVERAHGIGIPATTPTQAAQGGSHD